MAISICLLVFLLPYIDSLQIGRIKHASVLTNTTFIPTLDPQCSDCLCQCLTNNQNINSNDSKCYGINRFPSNSSCQRIEQAWIQERELVFDSTSDQFIHTIDLNFCSCYSSANILDNYANITPITVAHPSTRYITYNTHDDTLLILGNNLIGQYFASNMTRFRNWSVTNIPLAVLIDSTHIYISFYNNASVNQYDTQMRFIRSIKRPILPTINGELYDLEKWKNLLLITDKQFNLIWSIDLRTMNMSIYLNMTFYNISPFSIAIFNDYLYISQLAQSTIHVFDLITLSIRTIAFSNSISLYRLQKDPFCDRLWFGLNSPNYSSVPVFDLNTNEAQIYEAKGLLATTTVYIVAFGSELFHVYIRHKHKYLLQIPTSP